MQITKIVWMDSCQSVVLPPAFWMPGGKALITRVGEVIMIAPLGDDVDTVAKPPKPDRPRLAPSDGQPRAGFVPPWGNVASAVEILAALGKPANDNEPVKDARLLFAA